LALAVVPASGVSARTALEVVSPAGKRSLDLAALRRLPATAGLAGSRSSTGKVTLPVLYRGVALRELLGRLGGFDASQELVVTARDGYSITLGFDQVTKGAMAAYDAATGDTLPPDASLTAILAYERGGRPLDPVRDGALRLAVVGPRRDLVTDGHWSVKWVTKLEVRPARRDWSLRLEGALSEIMDRATFESGASPQCHGRTWRDEGGRVWSGIPLWLMVGWVDDGVRHERGAYNDSLAHAGYNVDVIAADGRRVSFLGARLRRDDGILLAWQVDGAPLPEPLFPLCLVGAGLSVEERIGGVVTIAVRVPPAGAAR
jgi:DMSO/TMAO reductase YedYZ molybdopterin-dependent catalytic subunit